MQIDFHHAITYVVSRLAGFNQDESHTIACASQYVDDATTGGKIFFDNQSAYQFIASGHKMLDYRNFRKLANHEVWIPFHFLPGNQTDSELAKHGVSEFVQRIICKTNSEVAQNMCKRVIDHKNSSPFTLFSLGVCAHVFADTWAHKSFAGIQHEVNQVGEIFDEKKDRHHELNDYRDKYHAKGKYKLSFRGIKDSFLSFIVSDLSPLGHGAVLSYPDRPYLHWHYEDFKGDVIERCNPKDYMAAIDHLFQFFCEYRGEARSMSDDDRKKIEELVNNISDEEDENRLKTWWDEIAAGRFSFGKEQCSYMAHGDGSWLMHALGMSHYDNFNSYRKGFMARFFPWVKDPTKLTIVDFPYQKEFLRSDWKHMRDALLFHRFLVLHKVLPHFDLCVV